MGFWLDDQGLFTDSLEYAHLIPECTNISVGYDRQHTNRESQDFPYALAVLRALSTLDYDYLATERCPSYGIWDAEQDAGTTGDQRSGWGVRGRWFDSDEEWSWREGRWEAEQDEGEEKGITFRHVSPEKLAELCAMADDEQIETDEEEEERHRKGSSSDGGMPATARPYFGHKYGDSWGDDLPPLTHSGIKASDIDWGDDQ
jgi:hypothetical protein